MGIDYTSDALIKAVRNKGSLTSGGEQLIDSQVIQELTDTLLTFMVPFINSQRQEYMVNVYDQPFNPSTVTYDLPERAMLSSLRDISFLDSGNTEVNIPLIDMEMIKRRNTWNVGWYPTVWGYYFQDNHIVIWNGTGNTTPSFPIIRMKYFRRPNALVATSDAGQITAINGQVVTVNNVPATWTTATTFDVIKGTPNFESRADDLTINNISNLNITFDTLPLTVKIGDWVCESGTSPIPQLPYELFNLLVQQTAAYILQYLGYPEAQSAKDAASRMEQAASLMINPRNVGTPVSIRDMGIFGP